MGPGPSNPYPEVTMALAGPVLGHLDPQFLALLDDTNDRLRQVFGTANPLTLPVSGTGSAGMEASFVNFARPGDAVVIGVNGVFGERMCDVAGRCGAEVVRVEAEWGEALDPERLLTAHPAPSIIAVVHAETSTGVRNEVEPLGRGKGDALLLVDTVTSLGGIEVAQQRSGERHRDRGVRVRRPGAHEQAVGIPHRRIVTGPPSPAPTRWVRRTPSGRLPAWNGCSSPHLRHATWLSTCPRTPPSTPLGPPPAKRSVACARRVIPAERSSPWWRS